MLGGLRLSLARRPINADDAEEIATARTGRTTRRDGVFIFNITSRAVIIADLHF